MHDDRSDGYRWARTLVHQEGGRALRRRLFWLIILALVLVLGATMWSHRFGVPEDFSDTAAEYKYGSIGSDHPMAMAPVPYWIWKVLPDILPPADVIAKGMGPTNGRTGYDAFGLVTEPAMEKPRNFVQGQTVFERPIGFSRRRVFGIDFVGVNCAFCHLSTIRGEAQAPQQIVLGGTGNTINIEQFFLYMFGAMGDPRFNADTVMPAVMAAARKQNADLGLFERLVYRFIAIPLIPKLLASRESAYFDFISAKNPDRLPNFGPGRVDTWAVYKRLYVDPPQRVKVEGIVDFPPIWNGRARAGMQMHWDGNTSVFEERNIVSALAVIGERLDYLDFPRVTRIAEFAEGLLPPRYADRIPEKFRPLDKDNKPVRIQPERAERGKALFQHHCADCHAPGGLRLGRVEPIDNLGTDGQRLKDFSIELADGLNRLQTKSWKLRHFKTQHGYVNNLLDGIWLRAPYLHNGSVPTLRDLLNPPVQRPKTFCRGNDVFDWVNVGYVSAAAAGDGNTPCGAYFLYDTSVTGNSNQGHLFGTDLDASDKDALVEFLKTL